MATAILASGESFSAFWQAAFEEYLKDTKRNGRFDVESLRGIKSVEELATHLHDSSQAFQEFRSKQRRVWDALRLFANPLVTTMKLATASAAGEAIGLPAAVVLGACVYLIKACENVSNAYDWIEQVLTELLEFSERLDVYSQSQMDPVLKKKTVGILSFALRVIGRSETLIRERRFREYLRVTFLGKDEKTKRLVEDLNKLFGSEQRFVLALTYAATQRVEEKVNENSVRVEAGLAEIKESVKTAEKQGDAALAEGQLQRVLNNSSAADDVEEQFAQNKRNMLKGTGEWLKHEAMFNQWMDRRADILWIFGGPGMGKSYLATWIIMQLLDSTNSEMRDKRLVAYFFVKETADVLRDANVILKTIAWQLISQDPEFKEHVAGVTTQRILTATAEDTWENLFQEFYGQVGRQHSFVSVVIDGLDEATPSTRRTILTILKDFMSKSRLPSQLNIQFAIIGRFSLRYDLDFERQERRYTVEVSKSKNERDIDKYICKRLEEVQVLKEIRKIKSGGLKEANKRGAMIRSRVLKGCDGVFLWAKLLIDSIIWKDWNQIKGVLKDPPRDLDDMIWSVFVRLAQDDELDHGRLRNMLLYMTYAKRPLSFGELDLFLSLPSRTPNLLLWKQTRGKLSSVFDLKFPQGRDPDLEIDETGGGEKDDDEAVGINSIQDMHTMDLNAEQDHDDEIDQGSFDFSGTNEGDDLDDDSQEEELFHPRADQSTRSPSWGFGKDALGGMSHYLSSGQIHTKVTFCHARIKDYLVLAAHSPTRNKPAFAELPSPSVAHAEMAITCIEALRMELSLDSTGRYLAGYAAHYLAAHLAEVKREHISDDQFLQIIKGLYWLIKTNKGAKSIMRADRGDTVFSRSNEGFLESWVCTDQYLRLVQDWFRDAKQRNAYEDLDDEEKLWIQTAADDLKELLRPWMMTASELWLGPTNDQSVRFHENLGFWAMHGWLSFLENNESLPAEIAKFEWLASLKILSTMTRERIETLAKWAGLEQDSFWYVAVGTKLQEIDQWETAIAHYEEAMKGHPQVWKVYELAGRLYVEREDYHKAIEWQQKAIEALPEDMAWLGGDLWPRISECASKVGDDELAHEAARNALEADPSSLRAQSAWILALDKRKDYAEIMRTVRSMKENTSQPPTRAVQLYRVQRQPSANHLIRWLTDFSSEDAVETVQVASRHQGETQFVLDQMQEAIQSMESENNVLYQMVMSIYIGDFQQRFHNGKVEEKIAALETALELLSLSLQSSSGIEEIASYRDIFSRYLARHCFDTAVALHGSESPEKATVFADKLKGLAVSVQTGYKEDYDGFDFFDHNYASLLWGRWQRDYVKVGEKVWRKCFQVRLLEQMNCLDDKDPANDEKGVRDLAESLFHAGNRKDAAAMLAVLFQPLELSVSSELDSAEESTTIVADEENGVVDTLGVVEVSKGDSLNGDSSNADSPKADGTDVSLLNITSKGVTYVCNNCHRGPAKVKGFYLCEVCYSTAFCDDCLAMVQDPTIKPGLMENFCNPLHDKYQAWPIPEEAKDQAAQYLGGSIRLRSEWLEKLRGEWLSAAV